MNDFSELTSWPALAAHRHSCRSTTYSAVDAPEGWVLRFGSFQAARQQLQSNRLPYKNGTPCAQIKDETNRSGIVSMHDFDETLVIIIAWRKCPRRHPKCNHLRVPSTDSGGLQGNLHVRQTQTRKHGHLQIPASLYPSASVDLLPFSNRVSLGFRH